MILKMSYNVVVDIDANPSIYCIDELKVSEIIKECDAKYNFMNHYVVKDPGYIKNANYLQKRISATVDHIATAGEYCFFLLEPNEEFEVHIKDRLVELWMIISLIHYRGKIENHCINLVVVIVGDYDKIYNYIYKYLPFIYRQTIDWLYEQENLSDKLKDNVKRNKTMKNEKRKANNPWLSGSYFLIVFLTVMATLAVISKIVEWYTLPIVFIGGLLTIPIIGVFQALNDNTLSEKGFLTIILESYKSLPLLKSNPTNDKK